MKQVFSEDLKARLINLTNGFSGADIESTIKELAYKAIVNGEETLTNNSIISHFENVVPLSKTNPEKINNIRAWGKERAVPASGTFSNISNSESGRKVLI